MDCFEWRRDGGHESVFTIDGTVLAGRSQPLVDTTKTHCNAFPSPPSRFTVISIILPLASHPPIMSPPFNATTRTSPHLTPTSNPSSTILIITLPIYQIVAGCLDPVFQERVRYDPLDYYNSLSNTHDSPSLEHPHCSHAPFEHKTHPCINCFYPHSSYYASVAQQACLCCFRRTLCS